MHESNKPFNNKMVYFIEKMLPFGASVSCSHYQHFSNCLRHLLEHRTGTQGMVVNYLDDFLFIASDEDTCNQLVRSFLNLCKDLNVPVAFEKTEWAAP